MFKRDLNLPLSRSFFLFGPRSTGKTTLLRELLPDSKALWLDLLEPDLERLLAQSPEKLSAILKQEQTRPDRRQWIVIDEIQKIPDLLSVVHSAIQKKQFHFALTGSSARKLKRGGADLLGGRASWFELSSLTAHELGDRFVLDDVLNWGSLPEIFELEPADRARFLKSYASVYLKEEIVAEQLVRKIQPFRNFLELVALQNAQIINYAKFAKDCGVDIVTIQSYFEILQDTLIGFELPPFSASIRKRQRKNPKFFYFDTGVTRALAGIVTSPILPRTSIYGRYFEQFLISEIRRLISTHEMEWKLSYLETKDGSEVDLIIDRGRSDRIALEIKSYDQVNETEVRAFERLAGDLPDARLLFVSQDPRPQQYGNVECLFWKDAVQQIFE